VKVLAKVTEKETGEPLIGVIMYIEELTLAKTTDQNGFLAVGLKPGKYNVRFEMLGFEKCLYQLDVLSSGEFRIEMKKVIIPLRK